MARQGCHTRGRGASGPRDRHAESPASRGNLERGDRAPSTATFDARVLGLERDAVDDRGDVCDAPRRMRSVSGDVARIRSQRRGAQRPMEYLRNYFN